MGFLKLIFVTGLATIFLTINLIPLELLPHQHDGTENPVHNNFTFVPRQITQTPLLIYTVLLLPLALIKLASEKPQYLLLSLTPNNKSPPVI